MKPSESVTSTLAIEVVRRTEEIDYLMTAARDALALLQDLDEANDIESYRLTPAITVLECAKEKVFDLHDLLEPLWNHPPSPQPTPLKPGRGGARAGAGRKKNCEE